MSSSLDVSLQVSQSHCPTLLCHIILCWHYNVLFPLSNILWLHPRPLGLSCLSFIFWWWGHDQVSILKEILGVVRQLHEDLQKHKKIFSFSKNFFYFFLKICFLKIFLFKKKKLFLKKFHTCGFWPPHKVGWRVIKRPL